jgi:hypothetical protein
MTIGLDGYTVKGDEMADSRWRWSFATVVTEPLLRKILRVSTYTYRARLMLRDEAQGLGRDASVLGQDGAKAGRHSSGAGGRCSFS